MPKQISFLALAPMLFVVGAPTHATSARHFGCASILISSLALGGCDDSNRAHEARSAQRLETARPAVTFKSWSLEIRGRSLKILGPDERGEPRWYAIATNAQSVAVDGTDLVITLAGGRAMRFAAGRGAGEWSLKKIRDAGMSVSDRVRRVYADEYVPLIDGREIKFVADVKPAVTINRTVANDTPVAAR